jgi:hypothetical protein
MHYTVALALCQRSSPKSGTEVPRRLKPALHMSMSF